MDRERQVIEATVRELRVRMEADANAPKTRGPELPSRPPLGGHRGDMYLGDLFAAMKRAAHRPDLRLVYNTRSLWHGAKAHLASLYNGDPDPRKLPKPTWEGMICNVKVGMVPEWTTMEDIHDPESKVYCWGWRVILNRCIGQHVIKPTEEIRGLLGESNYIQSRLGR